MTSEPTAFPVAMWLTDPLADDVAASLNRLAKSDDVRHIAVMPDVHLSGDVCNGTVVATHDLVYPLAVGSDIGCGMLAVKFDLEFNVFSRENDASRALAGLYQQVPSNKHSRSNLPDQLPSHLMETPLSSPHLEKQKDRDGLLQLGTLGRGNHFVEFQSDSEGGLWLMLHSGSRGMGQTITEHHLRSTRPTRSGLGFVEAATPTGQAYLSDVAWAIEYAMQNRLTMARAVEALMTSLFGASVDWSTLIHCHHNHVRRECHFGEDLWVHRKGALPAANHESGVIPGSMGTCSYHVTGRGFEAALQSSSHGAGRQFARRVARQQIARRDLETQMQDVWYDRRRGEMLRDEAPSAYKEIGRVMRAQRDLTRIVRQLRPILVYKGY